MEPAVKVSKKSDVHDSVDHECGIAFLLLQAQLHSSPDHLNRFEQSGRTD